MYLPRYHCELNPIERNWCYMKKISRQYINGPWHCLAKRSSSHVIGSSNFRGDEQVFFRTCHGYEMAYQSGCKEKEVEAQVKLYKSHRRVFSMNS